MSSVIIPCPFCGARGEVLHGSELSKYRGLFKVSCAAGNSDNDEEYPEGCYVTPETSWHSVEADAVAAWNTRPEAKPADQREAEQSSPSPQPKGSGEVNPIPERLFVIPAYASAPSGIQDVAGNIYADVYAPGGLVEDAIAVAEYMVRAINSHTAYRRVLARAMEHVGPCYCNKKIGYRCEICDIREEARSALSETGEGEK